MASPTGLPVARAASTASIATVVLELGQGVDARLPRELLVFVGVLDGAAGLIGDQREQLGRRISRREVKRLSA
ncbi:MAG: hypothetical protein U0263_23860 [Polyangiaceae bacterium]